MSDNFVANPGAGGDTFAADDVGGVKIPYSKIDIGGDGVSSPVTALNPMPVTGTVSTGLVQGLTDAQLRASPVPVSGTVTANTGLTQPLTDAQLRASAVPVVIGAGDVVSTGNSSTAVLAPAGVFTGTAVDTLGYANFSVGVFASHASATDGLSVQQSSDGTNWDNTDTYTIPATTGKVFDFNPALRYIRVVYTNGATLQTQFRLQTILRVNPFTRGSVQRPQDARTNDNDFDETISYGSMFNGTTWDRMRGDTTNGLDVDVTRLPALVLSAGNNTIGGVMATPSSAAAQGRAYVVTTAVAASLVLKAAAGNLYGVNVCTGGTAGYLMLLNLTSSPADGAVTPAKVWALAANSSFSVEFNPPLRFSTGCTAVFSSTGPFTKTASSTAFISGECV